MTLRYLSVCSGIEAASVAFHPYGWTPVAFSETDKSASRVLADHYPDVQNWGDMTKFQEWPDATVDVLCGGTPCQSFSVAGLRKGLADPRGNLMLTYGAIAGRYRPRWLVWENVPGVLSSNGGRDFGAFLGMLGQLGYGFAYRVLDAQHVRTRRFPFAVPQRRRRVFVVGHLGDWRRAAAVLFDRESLSGHPPPRRKAGQGIAADAAPSLTGSGRGVERAGETRGQDPVVAIKLQANSGDAAYCLTASAQNSLDSETETLIAVAQPVANAFAIQERAVSENPGAGPDGAGYTGEGAAYTLEARPQVQAVAHALRGEGHDASEDGTGRGVPIVPVAGALLKDSFSGGAGGRPEGAAAGHFVPVPPAVAFDLRGREGGSMPEGPHHTANIRAGDGGSSRSYVAESWAVRRLMPVECERLQGFPDGYTSLSGAKKPQADGPRYKQLGNSWPVNVVDWLAERIAEVDTWE